MSLILIQQMRNRSKSKALQQENYSRFFNKDKVKEMARYYNLKHKFENTEINKTFDEKDRQNGVHDADMPSLTLKNPVYFLKSNFDRPKVTPLQDTLNGSLFTNVHLHNEQRKATKFKLWAGIKVPLNINSVFNKQKDNINHWDECRDGVFHEI